MNVWHPEDLQIIAGFDCEQLESWLVQGLRDWDDRQKLPQAFGLLAYCFTPSDDIEPQLADMARHLPEKDQKNFGQAVGNSMHKISSTKEDFAFFNSMLRIAALTGRREPLEPMVDKLCEENFFQGDAPQIAQHLIAAGIMALASFPDSDNTIQKLVRKLRENPHCGADIATLPDYPAWDSNTKRFKVRLAL